MKKTIGIILVLFMLAGLAACTEIGNTHTGQPVPDELEEAGSTPVISPSLSIGWTQSDSTQVEVMEDYVIPALAKAFPEVSFSYIAITTDKAEALKTMSATGDLPDIFCTDSTIYETLLNAGNFTDLEPLLNKEGWLRQNYRNPENLYVNDDLYLISCGQNDYYTPTIYYNKDIFREHGLSVPDSMEDFLSLCAVLKEKGIYPMTTNTVLSGYFLMDALIGSYDPQLLDKLTGGMTDWSDPGISEALKVFDELKMMDAFSPDSPTKGESDCLAEFAQGQAAMWPTMSWFNDSLTPDKLGFPAGQFSWPSGNEDYPTGYLQLTFASPYGGWAINPEAEDIELCAEVLKALIEAEAQRHADNGVQQNFITTDERPPSAPLEIERMQAYESARVYSPIMYIVAMDASTSSDFSTDISMLISDNPDYLSKDFIEEFNVSWSRNTKIGP